MWYNGQYERWTSRLSDLVRPLELIQACVVAVYGTSKVAIDFDGEPELLVETDLEGRLSTACDHVNLGRSLHIEAVNISLATSHNVWHGIPGRQRDPSPELLRHEPRQTALWRRLGKCRPRG